MAPRAVRPVSPLRRAARRGSRRAPRGVVQARSAAAQMQSAETAYAVPALVTPAARLRRYGREPGRPAPRGSEGGPREGVGFGAGAMLGGGRVGERR